MYYLERFSVILWEGRKLIAFYILRMVENGARVKLCGSEITS